MEIIIQSPKTGNTESRTLTEHMKLSQGSNI